VIVIGIVGSVHCQNIIFCSHMKETVADQTVSGISESLHHVTMLTM